MQSKTAPARSAGFARSGEDAADGWFADIVEPRHLGSGLSIAADIFDNVSLLCGCQLRPPIRPSALASASPALVRSRIIARSNSAKLPTICMIMQPPGVVVSMASVSDRNPAPAASMRSIKCRRSLSERVSRSSLQTTTVSAPSQGRGYGLDCLRQSPTAPFDAGLCQSHGVRIKMACQANQLGSIVDTSRETLSAGKVRPLTSTLADELSEG